MGQREETTEELSERVLARLRREYSLVSSEVWVDDVHRVDFVGFRPARNSPFPSSIERGEFVFVEVKSCMNDFKSGHGLTFRGDANWLVCPAPLPSPPITQSRMPAGRTVTVSVWATASHPAHSDRHQIGEGDTLPIHFLYMGIGKLAPI